MPIKRRIFVNSISGIIQVVVSSIVLVIVYGLFIRTAGTEILGIWSILNAFMAVARLGELGFGAAVTKFVAHYTARGDSRRALLAFTTGTVSVTVFVGFTAGSLYLLIQSIMVKMLPSN